MGAFRFLRVFLCGAGLAVGLAVGKALAFGGIGTLPPVKVVGYAASVFGLVVALIDWGLLRDLLFRPRAFVERARYRPIVFRQIFPPTAKRGLSFYGGVPVGPRKLVWPRCRNKPGGAPLSFVMQWDCAELAKQDGTGLMPRDGVLYLFADLTWGAPFDFEFIHVPGAVKGFEPLPVPDGLPAVFGTDGAYQIPYCSPEISKAGPDVPRLLPKWPFDPVAFDYPREDTEVLWWGERLVAEALLRVQFPAGAPEPRRADKATKDFRRPFAAFPHDYAAIRVVAARVIHELRHPSAWVMRDVPEREATFERWRAEAVGHYNFAAAHEPGAKAAQSVADELWRWIEGLEPLLRLQWSGVLEECANVSLGLNSAAVGELPEELLARCAERHQLASTYIQEKHAAGELKMVRSIHAPPPNRMFGPPSCVQGDAEEYLADWVLLLELSSNDAIGYYLGEGVLEFLIRPGDLKERRFDKVKLVASGY